MSSGAPASIEGLAPGFLVAMPQLQDPNFSRTVVLLLKSNEAGAFGLVINRVGPLSVADLCEQQDIPYGGGPGRRVMIGGPVEQDSHLLVLHGEEGLYSPGAEQEMVIAPRIRLVTAVEGLRALAGRSEGRYRCYLGYAGWGPEQLQQELSQGAWLPLECDAGYVFDEAPAAVWGKALRRAGIDPISLVPGGEVN
jgi:putative transcriptional regulator